MKFKNQKGLILGWCLGFGARNLKFDTWYLVLITKTIGQGNGLGLSLSYDIVKAHGSTLEVLNTGESGTTFQLHFR